MTENNWKEEEEKIKQAFGDKTWAQIKSEESWRIFKIMSEFVEGIDKLSKICTNSDENNLDYLPI